MKIPSETLLDFTLQQSVTIPKHAAETLESALAMLKRDFGLNATDEVKWNGMPPLAQKAREELSQELMVSPSIRFQ